MCAVCSGQSVPRADKEGWWWQVDNQHNIAKTMKNPLDLEQPPKCRGTDYLEYPPKRKKTYLSDLMDLNKCGIKR